MLEQREKFKFFLELGGNALELPQSPEGWEEITINYKRDFKYWGVIRSFTFPYKFVLASSRYLRQTLFTQGVDFIISLRIDILDPEFQTYSKMYSGELDLSQSELDHITIDIPVMDGDLQAKIKAYEKTVFEFVMDGTETINLPGTDFVDYANYNGAVVASGIEKKTIGLNLESSDIVLNKIEALSQAEDLISFVNLMNYSNCFLEANVTTSVAVKGFIDCDFRNFGSPTRLYYRVLIMDNTAVSGGNIIEVLTTQNYSRGDHSGIVFNFDLNLNIVAGRKYFLVAQPFYYGIHPDINFSINNLNLRVSYAGTSENVTVKAMKPIDVFEKLINFIRPVTNIKSDFLTGVNVLLTSGDAIRGIENPKMKTSFADFYKSMDAIGCIGMSSFDNIAVLEEREYFLRNTYRIADLDDIKDLKILPFTAQMYSSIKVGYPSESYQNERGREEFNQGQDWKTPTYRVQRDLDIKSVYRADQFGIEELRKKQLSGDNSNETNTDSSGDNDVFMLMVKNNPVNNVYQLITAEDYYRVLGVSDRTFTYNIGLSPKHNLMKHMAFIRSSFWGVNEDAYITFASSDKNADLEVSLTPEDIFIEREAIYIKTFEERFFIPFLVKFTTDYPDNLKNLIDASPEGYIRFKYNNAYFSGYIYELNLDLSRNSEQEFTLILSKDNNLLNFDK